MTKIRATTVTPEFAARRGAELLPAILAAALGAFLVIGAGFAPIPAVHNAGHDTRHAFAFPCH